MTLWWLFIWLGIRLTLETIVLRNACSTSLNSNSLTLRLFIAWFEPLGTSIERNDAIRSISCVSVSLKSSNDWPESEINVGVHK